MFILGVTGGIGCGKSTVAALLKEAGLAVLDADAISHELTAPQGKSLPAIVEAFGPDILAEDGSLSRQEMARLVFQDKKQLDRLSGIIHRDVLEEIGLRLDQLSEQKVQAVALDVPLPVKHGFLDRCDQVWCVWADENIRLERLFLRGLSREEAKLRIRVQLNEEEYRKLSTHMIYNNGDLSDLRTKVQELLESELQSRGIAYQSLC